MRRVDVFLFLLVLLFSGTAVPASGQALPDIEPSVPFDVNVVARDGRWYLGFATAASNVGPGALRIQGQGDGSGAMAARQLSEDGALVLNPNVGTLSYVATVTHQHWHYMDFMRYELRGVDRPSVLHDQKQGFCLGDAPFVSGWCSQNTPVLTTTELGLRPGGMDIYSRNVEGQEILIDPASAPAGRYVVTARIGPTGVLRETRVDNNVASTLISLTWPTSDPQLQPAPRPIATLKTCLGERCKWRLPAGGAAAARRLVRKALRRTLGRRSARRVRVTGCRTWRARAHDCRTRRRGGFSGSVRVWYVVDTAATRWYYTVKGRDCREGLCSRRIRRVGRLGGTVTTTARPKAVRAGATRLLCRLPR